MKIPEAHIQYVWEHALYSKLLMPSGEGIKVLKRGTPNLSDGPDFQNARIQIGSIEWAGAIEIHHSASDWHKHKHHEDPAYNSVILHVVLDADEKVQSEQGQEVPTALMQVDPLIWAKMTDFELSKQGLSCLPELKVLPRIDWCRLQDRLLIERLEQRQDKINSIGVGVDWDQRLYTLLLRYLGMGHNNDAFEALAGQLPVAYLRKHANNRVALEAMLMGTAGLLDKAEDEYAEGLRKEYQFYAHKFALKPLPKGVVRQLRLRPAIFPARMLAIAAALLEEPQTLNQIFSADTSLDTMRHILQKKPSPYFQKHYSFARPCKGRTLSGLGASSRESIIINVFLPIRWTYFYGMAPSERCQKLLEATLEQYRQLKAENNGIVRLFSQTAACSENAGDTQALVHLYKHYCQQTGCMRCPAAPLLFRQLRQA